MAHITAYNKSTFRCVYEGLADFFEATFQEPPIQGKALAAGDFQAKLTLDPDSYGSTWLLAEEQPQPAGAETRSQKSGNKRQFRGSSREPRPRQVKKTRSEAPEIDTCSSLGCQAAWPPGARRVR